MSIRALTTNSNVINHWEVQFSNPEKGPKSEENDPPPRCQKAGCGPAMCVCVCFAAGCQEDIDSLIRETSDATQLATWCTVYKSELARKRSECHSLSESLRKAKRDLELSQLKLADQTTELSVANARIAALEDDIASQVSS